jgi:hypothetical protein
MTDFESELSKERALTLKLQADILDLTEKLQKEQDEKLMLEERLQKLLKKTTDTNFDLPREISPESSYHGEKRPHSILSNSSTEASVDGHDFINIAQFEKSRIEEISENPVVLRQAKVPEARWGQTLTSIGNRLIVYGGQGDENGVTQKESVLGDVFVFDLATKSWDEPVNCESVPRAVSTFFIPCPNVSLPSYYLLLICATCLVVAYDIFFGGEEYSRSIRW